MAVDEVEIAADQLNGTVVDGVFQSGGMTFFCMLPPTLSKPDRTAPYQGTSFATQAELLAFSPAPREWGIADVTVDVVVRPTP